jgi:hypothetical protein
VLVLAKVSCAVLAAGYEQHGLCDREGRTVDAKSPQFPRSSPGVLSCPLGIRACAATAIRVCARAWSERERANRAGGGMSVRPKCGDWRDVAAARRRDLGYGRISGRLPRSCGLAQRPVSNGPARATLPLPWASECHDIVVD